MLAQNFKTAAELGIVDAEYTALLAALYAFERGEVGGIDMGYYRHDCGSPSCICGWAHHLSNGAAFPEIANVREIEGHAAANHALERRLPVPLQKLFGLKGALNLDEATPERAVIAIRNYLSSGEPRWAEALA